MLCRNLNTRNFITSELNEEIPSDEKHFIKRKELMKFTTRPRCKEEKSITFITIIAIKNFNQQVEVAYYLLVSIKKIDEVNILVHALHLLHNI